MCFAHLSGPASGHVLKNRPRGLRLCSCGLVQDMANDSSGDIPSDGSTDARGIASNFHIKELGPLTADEVSSCLKVLKALSADEKLYASKPFKSVRVELARFIELEAGKRFRGQGVDEYMSRRVWTCPLQVLHDSLRGDDVADNALLSGKEKRGKS